MSIIYIVEEIDNEEYLFWFKKSNKYLICNYSIYKLLQNEIKKRNNLQNTAYISKNLSKIEIEIKNLLDELLKPLKKNKYNSPKLKETKFTINKNYKFNNRVLKFSFENKRMLELIHPKFEHLESKCLGEKNFKFFKKKESISFYIDDKHIGNYSKNQMHELQGKVSMEMTSYFHNKKEHDWIGVFHGSTLKEGFYKYANKLSKDFINKKEYLVDKSKGKFKYFTVDIDDKFNSHNCNYIIDVKYGKKLKNNISKSTKGKALHKLLPDSWMSEIYNNSKKFYEWIHNSNFYELTYNDNKKAIELVNKIF